MFSFFKKSNPILSRREARHIVKVIQALELKTSGEIRVYMEGECPFDDPMTRAAEIFSHLGMQKTQFHNAVLLYIAVESQKFAILGDEAIYTKVGTEYWQSKAAALVTFFKNNEFAKGIEQCLTEIGTSLATHFPATSFRKNELPDDIVFGKFN
jgi:uncharacterized membrane protein